MSNLRTCSFNKVILVKQPWLLYFQYLGMSRSFLYENTPRGMYHFFLVGWKEEV